MSVLYGGDLATLSVGSQAILNDSQNCIILGFSDSFNKDQDSVKSLSLEVLR